MYCPNCGRAVRDNENFCIRCGAPLVASRPDDGDTELCYAIAGGILPLLGFVLYFVYEAKRPRRAKAALNGALVGFGIRVALSLIVRIINFMLGLLSLGSLFTLALW